jgi:glycerol kinase
MRETTALGAAIAAGLAVGLWRNFAELRDINRSGGGVFEPQITHEESARKFEEWEKAVRMSKGWMSTNQETPKETIVIDKVHGKETSGTPTVKPENTAPDKDINLDHSPLISDMVANSGCILKAKPKMQDGLMAISLAKTPLISISGDLEEADEEELLLELRKVEILQKLKKLRNLKLKL